MDTTTQEPPPAEDRKKPITTEVMAIDVEHDIDAKKTFFWLGGSLVFVILCLLALFKAFQYSVRGQQHEVIEALPPVELRQLRSDEDYILKKMPPKGEADTRTLAEIRQSIMATTDQIIEAYLPK